MDRTEMLLWHFQCWWQAQLANDYEKRSIVGVRRLAFQSKWAMLVDETNIQFYRHLTNSVSFRGFYLFCTSEWSGNC